MKLKKIKKVVVNCDVWLRGKPGRLLNDDGDMCCLGFECVQRGFSKKEILNKTSPSELNRTIPNMTTKLRGYFENNYLIFKCISINDSPIINDSERMSELKKLFRRRKITIQFKNVPKDVD